MSEEELSRKIKRGEIDFEFTYDRLTMPGIVKMTVYGYEGNPLFIYKLMLNDWDKLAKLVSRFDGKLKEQMDKEDGNSDKEYEEFLKSQELVPI